MLWLAPAAPGDADVDAVAIRPTGADAEGLETVIEVRDEDELEEVFEVRDPEIVLISPRENGKDPLELALELLPDVPAGKLAIADVDVGDRDEVLKLERAGFDAVLVAPGHVGLARRALAAGRLASNSSPAPDRCGSTGTKPTRIRRLTGD